MGVAMQATIRISVTTIIISRSEKPLGRLRVLGSGWSVGWLIGAICIASPPQVAHIMTRTAAAYASPATGGVLIRFGALVPQAQDQHLPTPQSGVGATFKVRHGQERIGRVTGATALVEPQALFPQRFVPLEHGQPSLISGETQGCALRRPCGFALIQRFHSALELSRSLSRPAVSSRRQGRDRGALSAAFECS